MKKNLQILKVISLIILLLTFSFLPALILHLDIAKFSNTGKVLYNLATDLTFLALLFFIYRKTLTNDWRNFTKNLGNNLEFAFKYWLIGVIVMIISNLLITFFAPNAIAGNEEAVRNLINLYPLYMIFSVSIYAPFTEELIFRKGIRDCIKNKYLYILTSGIIFGSLHVISSVTTPYDLLYLIPYCSLGITFAYLYTKTNNIFSSMSMHALHNTLTIGLYLIGTTLWKK